MTTVNNNQQNTNNQGGNNMPKEVQDAILALNAVFNADQAAYTKMVSSLYENIQKNVNTTKNIGGMDYEVDTNGNIKVNADVLEKLIVAQVQAVPQSAVQSERLADVQSVIGSAVKPQFNVNVEGTITQDTLKQAAQQAVNTMQPSPEEAQKQLRVQSLINQMASLEYTINMNAAMGQMAMAESYQLTICRAELEKLTGMGLKNMASNAIVETLNTTSGFINTNVTPVFTNVARTATTQASGVLEEIVDYIGSSVNAVLDLLPTSQQVVQTGCTVAKGAIGVGTSAVNGVINVSESSLNGVSSMLNIKW